MAYPFHNAVTMKGFHQEAFHLTMNISGTVTAADIGKAVSLDTTKANTAKLAGDGDAIIGRLASYEGRTVEGINVGAVEFRFANAFPLKASDAAVVGDTVIGGGSGTVKKAVANDPNVNFIAEVITNADSSKSVVVVKF